MYLYPPKDMIGIQFTERINSEGIFDVQNIWVMN